LEPPVAQHALPARKREGPLPERPVVHAGMEFPVLAAGIAARRQVAQQGGVELAAAERGVELRGVDATQDRAIAAIDEPPREARGVLAPQREQAAPAEARELRFAVGAHVREEQVAERD